MDISQRSQAYRDWEGAAESGRTTRLAAHLELVLTTEAGQSLGACSNVSQQKEHCTSQGKLESAAMGAALNRSLQRTVPPASPALSSEPSLECSAVSMPQHLAVAVISGRPEVAAAVTTILRGHQRGISPWFAAASNSPQCRPELAQSLASRGLVISVPVHPSLLDPREVDLWLALDEEGEADARSLVFSPRGPAPDGFYRTVWPSPVARLHRRVSNPPNVQTAAREIIATDRTVHVAASWAAEFHPLESRETEDHGHDYREEGAPVTIPVSITLLWFWFRPETKEHFAEGSGVGAGGSA